MHDGRKTIGIPNNCGKLRRRRVFFLVADIWLAVDRRRLACLTLAAGVGGKRLRLSNLLYNPCTGTGGNTDTLHLELPTRETVR